jgi:hypothetical protein
MNIGMLWFDNDPKVTLDLKIARAAHYYHEKYGKNPTLCFVHPNMLSNGKKAPEPAEPVQPVETAEKRYAECGVEIRPNPSVLPNHLWIGVNGTASPS